MEVFILVSSGETVKGDLIMAEKLKSISNGDVHHLGTKNITNFNGNLESWYLILLQDTDENHGIK